MATAPRKTKTVAPAAEPTASAEHVMESVETVVAEPVVAEPVVAEPAKVQKATPKAAAETAKALETSFGAASKSLQAFSAKAMEAYQANAAASVQYVQALANVRSVSEAIALQSEHMRKQYETLTAQAKELTALAQQVAADAAAPLKEQMDKVFKARRQAGEARGLAVLCAAAPHPPEKNARATLLQSRARRFRFRPSFGRHSSVG